MALTGYRADLPFATLDDDDDWATDFDDDEDC